MGEFSSPESMSCVDSYSVSVPPHVTAVAHKRPWSFCQKCRWQVTPKHAYSVDPTKSEWADYTTVLAGELSLMSALAAGHLVKSHLKHNRYTRVSLLLPPVLLLPFLMFLFSPSFRCHYPL